MSRIIIVRHGNTFENGEAARRIGASIDLPLTVTGLRQADLLGRLFARRGMVFARVLSSPLGRTMGTAERILRQQRGSAIRIEEADWLREIDHGPDEGQLEDAVIARIGSAAITAWNESGTQPPGWKISAAARLAAWSRFYDAPTSGDSLLVTSNGAARFALLASPMERKAGKLSLRTGAFGEINRFPDGTLELVAWDIRPAEVDSSMA